MVGGGLGIFYLKAGLSCFLALIATIPRLEKGDSHVQSTGSWKLCRDLFPTNFTHCGQFDDDMNRSVSKLRSAVENMRTGVDAVRSGIKVTGFDPPIPDDKVQEEIDELKKELVAVEDEASKIDPSGDIDTLREQMATIQQIVTGLTNRLDNIWNEVDDKFQPQINQLATTLITVVFSIASLKTDVAKLEDRFEAYKITNLASQIASGGDQEGSALLYENSDFRGSSDNIITSVAILGYECVLQDATCLAKFIQFFSLLDPYSTFLGYKALYYATHNNGLLYDKPHPIVLTNRLQQLRRQNGNNDVGRQTDNFLVTEVHQMLTGLVRLESGVNLTTIYGDGELYCNDNFMCGLFAENYNGFTYTYSDDDAASIRPDCAYAEGTGYRYPAGPIAPVDGTTPFVCLAIRPWNRVSVKWTTRVGPYGDQVDWDDRGGVWVFEDNSRCQFVYPPDKYTSVEGDTWFLFGWNFFCRA